MHLPPGLELVEVAGRSLAPVVDDEDVVGQEEHEVALVPVTRHREPNRIELERELVAECAVEPEMGDPRGCGRDR